MTVSLTEMDENKRMTIGVGDEFVFLWRIENYLACYQKVGEMIESPSFIADNVDYTKWLLNFYPKGFSEESKDFVSCVLQRIDFGNDAEEIIVDCIFELINEKDDVFHICVSNCELLRPKQSTEPLKLIAINELSAKMSGWTADILQLRCRIMKSTVEKRVCVGCSARTKIETERYCFAWDVETDTTFNWTDQMVLPYQNEPKLEMSLYAPDDIVIVKIQLMNNPPCLPLLITLRFIIICKNYCGCFLNENCLFEPDGKTIFEFPSGLRKEKLAADSEFYAFNLKCDVTVSSRIESSVVESYKFGITLTDASAKSCTPSSLQTNLRCLLTSDKYSDVQLRANDVVLSAHKLILAARSAVFSAMFNQEESGSEVQVVEIADLDEKSLRSFLEFIYTEAFDEIDYESSLKLLVAAEKYEILSLKEKCSTFLLSKLSETNVCEVLAVADTIHDEFLKESVIDFILDNSSDVLASSEWSHLLEEKAELAFTVLAKLSSDLGCAAGKKRRI